MFPADRQQGIAGEVQRPRTFDGNRGGRVGGPFEDRHFAAELAAPFEDMQDLLAAIRTKSVHIDGPIDDNMETGRRFVLLKEVFPLFVLPYGADLCQRPGTLVCQTREIRRHTDDGDTFAKRYGLCFQGQMKKIEKSCLI